MLIGASRLFSSRARHLAKNIIQLPTNAHLSRRGGQEEVGERHCENLEGRDGRMGRGLGAAVAEPVV